jgi:hypothetical protein
LVEFQSFVFRQIWAVLGRICCMTVAESLP